MDSEFRIGEWLVNPQTNLLSNNGNAVRLEPKVMALLAYLAQHKGQVISKEQLLNTVWADTFVSEQVLKVAISELRKALGDDAKQPRFINTIPKRGYQLIAPVNLDSSTPTSEQITQTASSKRRRSPVVFLLITLLVLLAALWWLIQSASRPDRAAQPQAIRSLVVLPLKNLSGDANEEYFADGLTEAMTTDLAKLDSWRVISTASAMQYKQRHATPAQIARELQVEALLEGSVLRVGDRVRLNIRLIEAASEQHLWAETYERNVTDLLALQAEMAADVARAVSGKLRPPAAPRTLNPTAYEAYLKGRFFWNQRTYEAIEKSLTNFQQAVAADPNEALYYSGLADAYTLLAFYAPNGSRELYTKAKEAAQRALELDESVAEAHTSLAGILHKFDMDWAAAEREFQRALQLNPNYPTAHQWYAIYLISKGEFDRALAEIDRALEIDPHSLIIRTDKGWLLYAARRYEEATTLLKQVLERDAKFGSYFLILAYNQQGQHGEALAEAERVLASGNRSPNYVSLLGYTQARAGNRKAALAALAELQRMPAQSVPAYQFALLYLALGDKEQALGWLEKIHEQHSSWQPFLRVEPELDDLQSDPRFQAYLQKLGLPSF